MLSLRSASIKDSKKFVVCSKKILVVGNDVIRLLPTANCQLPTANCQLPTANLLYRCNRRVDIPVPETRMPYQQIIVDENVVDIGDRLISTRLAIFEFAEKTLLC